MMVEWLLETPDHESEAELTTVVTEYVTRLTGKQTIYQMIQLAEEISKRGGQPHDPLVYKHAYLDRLWERIEDRVAGLKAGTDRAGRMMVPGAGRCWRRCANAACAATWHPAPTSRTCSTRPRRCRLRPTSPASTARWTTTSAFSKKLLIERIIAEHGLSGPEFVAFGDGYVEIEDTVHVGGIGVGVATNEAERAGIDEWKRSPPDRGRRRHHRARFPGARGAGGVFV